MMVNTWSGGRLLRFGSLYNKALDLYRAFGQS
jgi:hypothetical protein